MNYYPHHIGDFDKATRHLTRLERSIYRDLMDLYYDTEKPISLDLERVCKKIIARSSEESTAVEQVLNEFFTEIPTGWYHERCEEEISKYHANTSQKSLAGKASAAAKAQKKQQELNGKSTAVGRTTNGTSTNHKPITINHKLEAKASLPEPVVPPCPIDSLIDKFTQRLPMLPGIRKSLFKTGKNADAMRTRWRWVMTAEHEKGERKGQRLATSAAEGIDWFDKYFSFVSESDFLTGASGKWTACDLAWLLTASKFESVLSGKYHQKEEVAA